MVLYFLKTSGLVQFLKMVWFSINDWLAKQFCVQFFNFIYTACHYVGAAVALVRDTFISYAASCAQSALCACYRSISGRLCQEYASSRSAPNLQN